MRLDMLRESIEVMRKLWTGEQVSHHGEHYTVENARIYTAPDEPPPVIVSGFGPKAAQLAGEVGDGYFGTSPESDLLETYAQAGGSGEKMALMKACWGEDAQAARELAHGSGRRSVCPASSTRSCRCPATSSRPRRR